MSRPPPAAERYESRLKTFRVARGLSQNEIAERVGLTRQAIYMIEAGRYLLLLPQFSNLGMSMGFVT